MFSDVCESVKSTGRDLSVNIFRQILTVAPDFYTHSWHNSKLVIDCPFDLKQNNATTIRKQVFKQKLVERCIEAFFAFC